MNDAEGVFSATQDLKPILVKPTKGLTGGEQTGIALGVIMGIAIAVLVVVLLKKKKQKKFDNDFL